MAGAVFLATGSRICAAGMMPSSCSCSATMKRCSWLLIRIGAAHSGSEATRAAVSCSRLREVTSGRTGFGRDWRDSGHRRVPLPPHRITG
jgi:hypothetical protein